MNTQQKGSSILKEIYITLNTIGLLKLAFVTIYIAYVISITDHKLFLAFHTMALTVMYLTQSASKHCKNISVVIRTMIVVTFFELLYIWSYSPKIMIPESVMESILIALPVFKFCVFIYVVTLNRIANQGEGDVQII